MTQPLVYVDASDVRDGALPELKLAMRELSDFVERNEPRLISYAVYFSEDERRMAVVHIHADAASLDYHFDVAGSRFAAVADLVSLSSIKVFGRPSESARGLLKAKLELLGSGAVSIHLPHAGFGRSTT